MIIANRLLNFRLARLGGQGVIPPEWPSCQWGTPERLMKLLRPAVPTLIFEGVLLNPPLGGSAFLQDNQSRQKEVKLL